MKNLSSGASVVGLHAVVHVSLSTVGWRWDSPQRTTLFSDQCGPTLLRNSGRGVLCESMVCSTRDDDEGAHDKGAHDGQQVL